MLDFNTTLEALHPSSWAVIEYFATWCPACMHFAPEYEKIARYLTSSSVQIDGNAVFVGRVDCAKEILLCELYKISSFPTILVGPPASFMRVQLPTLRRFSPHPVKDAAGIVKWIGKMTNSSTLAYTGPDGVVVPALPALFADLQHEARNKVWEVKDVEGATVQLWRIITTTPSLHKGEAKRSALLSLLLMWEAAHPSDRCRESSARIVRLYDLLWPASADRAPPALRDHVMCGSTAAGSDVSWGACRGTKPATRGYTCGLWLLFHAVSVRLPATGASGQLFMTALLAFNDHFFQCDACHKHFAEMLGRPETAEVVTRRDAVLWIWRAHNEVNARLAEQDTAGATGDPDFPKVQWPGSVECPSCRLPSLNKQGTEGGADGGSEAGIKWNLDEVVAYLSRTFGGDPHLGAPGAKAAGNAKLQLEHGVTADSAVPLSAHPLEDRRGGDDQPPPRAFNRLAVWVLISALLLMAAYYAFTRASSTRHLHVRTRVAAAGAGGEDPAR